MVIEEIDDELGFFREDFSTESDWEVFNAQLCEYFQSWELSKSTGREFEEGELFNCEWNLQKNTLKLLNKEMDICYHSAILPKNVETEVRHSESAQINPIPALHQDLMSLKNTFGTPIDVRNSDNLHPLARYYGLRRFVVIQPHNLELEYLTKPDEFFSILSSITVVAAEVCSTVPIFVQIYDPKWNFFVGVGLATMQRTNFDMIALDYAPPHCRYLSGLLNIFKEKLPTTFVRPATVSVRNTYLLDTIHIRIPMRVPFSQMAVAEEPDDVKLSTTQFFALPNGYFLDSCTNVYVLYTWPEIAENIAIDSALRSDFVPSKAISGNMFQVANATSYLSSCLRDFQKIRNAENTLESFLGRNFSGIASATDTPNPLNQITSSRLRYMRKKNRKNLNLAQQTQTTQPKKLPGPISDNEINQMLYYIFPNINTDAALFPYLKKTMNQKLDFHRVKSAQADSLTLRVSCLLATILAHFGGKNGLAQFWASFTRELRKMWDNGIVIPGVASGFPDTRTCLLHQKLQMLNVCIKRNEIDYAFNKTVNVLEKSTLSEVNDDEVITDDDNVDDDVDNDDDDDDDDDNADEFYDCSNDEDETKISEADAEGAGGDVRKPEGRQCQLRDLKLLDTDEPLYIPLTQDPVPKTEDQLYDDAEVMLKLGPGISIQMMCSSLLSDMEAFKAANPKCQMADFIRWHSPNDWEEIKDESGTIIGQMSGRMLTPDNTWQTIWAKAKPVPAWRQKRLFDHTNEALKVLHYLETRTIGEIYALTIIPLLHATIFNLKDIIENAKIIEIFGTKIESLLSDLNQLSQEFETIEQKDGGLISKPPNFDYLLNQIESLERQLYQFKCFERMSGYPFCTKFDDVKRQFKEILENGGCCKFLNRKDVETEADGDGDGNKSGGMLNPKFKNEMSEHLISKDYVIRIDGEIISQTKGQTGPQFLRAIVTGEKIRICGAFTENTTFI